MNTGVNCPDIDTLAAVLALLMHSQIVVPATLAEGRAASFPLPAGFEDVDRAVLEWIAAEGRRVGRGLARL